MQVTLLLSPETAVFYQKIACLSGQSLEKVLSDALFKLAGELALESLRSTSEGEFT